MGKILDEPKFPVIYRAPSFWQTVGNFNLKDWGTFAGLTAISYPLGYAAGGNPSPPFARLSGSMNRPSAAMAAIIGGLAGFLLGYQNSCGRLMGFNSNEEEVKAAAAARQ